MSGLLRRIKRSRPADAGEPLPEGQAAAPEGAAPATDPATGPTQPLPGNAPPAEQPAPAAKPADKPVLLADPGTPAGVDPATAPMRPPAGRRGRLRRRLRYLRRARELMLRDLGGLLYEIHRTGGGNVESHGNIVRAKVQRIAGLDAEAHALETALASPRAEAVVFQPGVGGTCPTCGELYGSAARYCANCGTPLGVAALPAPAVDPSPTPAPATRESVFGRPAPPAQALSSGDPLRTPDAAASAPVVAAAQQGESVTAGAERPGDAGATDRAATDETVVMEPAAGDDTGVAAAGEDAATDPAASDDTAMAEPAADAEVAADPAGSDDTVAGAASTGQEAASDGSAGDDILVAEPAAGQDAPAPAAGEVAAADAAASDETAVAEPTASEDAPADAALSEDTEVAEPAAGADDAAEPAAGEGAAAGPASGENAATGDDPATSRDAAAGERPHDAARNPFSGLRNGRAEDHTPPELSSGDPLVFRERS